MSKLTARSAPGLAAAVMILGLLAGTGSYFLVPALARLAEPVPEAPSSPLPLPPTALLQGGQQVPVLMYHDVVDRAAGYFDVSTEEFGRHLALLQAARAQVVRLADLYDHLRTGAPLPDRAVVLTFDGGCAGQLRNAYPLLRRYGYPATFFVPTGAVGRKSGREHLSWEELQRLDREGLVSVESLTVSRPEDLRRRAPLELRWELQESRQVLQEKLGRPVRFLAYPLGNADGRVARLARAAGYEMAFTMGPGWARAPADAYLAPRLLQTRLPEICRRLASGETRDVYRSRVLRSRPEPIESGEVEEGRVRLRYIRGGRLSGVRLAGRELVPELVRRSGAVGGLNGTFFSDARVNSAGAGIVGPVLSRFGPGFAPGLPGDRERIADRPMVLIAPDRIAFLPFQPLLARDEEGVERLLPGVTDCFVAGAWLVHRGKALDREALEGFGLDNVFDFRPRAVVGVDTGGRVFLGASTTGNESHRLARTLEGLGLEECVLLDSGFSTSLVLGQEVLVSGIRRTNLEARPVPHALLLYPVDPVTLAEVPSAAAPGPDFVGPPEPPWGYELTGAVGEDPAWGEPRSAARR